PFQYSVDNGTLEDDATMENLKFTVHLAYVKDANGCTDTMTFYMAPPMVTIPDFFTPNGDGINDQWIPFNLKEVYSDAKVTIFDRFGKKLAEYRASDPDWDGTYNNKPMPSTDYWYEIDIEEIDKQYVGHFTLLRQ
ncbi:MAG: T9SS type B sorting domain-containing protein, partial [Paludibacteraceae bacterium]